MARTTDERVANMDEHIQLPRKNGELVFEAPWEARAFGIAVALHESGVYAWRDFSQALAAQIAAAEQSGDSSTYYERWLASLEKLVMAHGLITDAELEAHVAEQALHDAHDHDHEHHDHHHGHGHGHSHEHDPASEHHGHNHEHHGDHRHNGHTT